MLRRGSFFPPINSEQQIVQRNSFNSFSRVLNLRWKPRPEQPEQGIRKTPDPADQQGTLIMAAFQMFLLAIVNSAVGANSVKKIKGIFDTLSFAKSPLGEGESICQKLDRQVNILEKALGSKGMANAARKLAEKYYAEPSIDNLALVQAGYHYAYKFSDGPKQSFATGRLLFSSRKVLEHSSEITADVIHKRIAQQKKGKSTRLGKFLSCLEGYHQEDPRYIRSNSRTDSAPSVPMIKK